MVENSLKHFTIGKLNVTLSVLGVVFELSLVIGPSVSELRKVLIVELFIKNHGFGVIDPSLTIKLIIIPMAFISYLSIFIVKFTEAMHLVVLPLPFIMSSVLEIQNAVSVLFIIALVALIASSLRDILFYEL
jgi:hypothetical protein